MKSYRQCKLRRGATTTTAWIEDRAAKVGKSVEVKDLPHADLLWKVVEAYGHEIPDDMLKEHQRMNRNSLLSVEPMGAPPKQVGKVK